MFVPILEYSQLTGLKQGQFNANSLKQMLVNFEQFF